MKLVTYECEDCAGRGEILLTGETVTAQDLEGDPVEAWVEVRADGQLRCRECGGRVLLQRWKDNRSRYFLNDRPDFSGSVKTQE